MEFKNEILGNKYCKWSMYQIQQPPNFLKLLHREVCCILVLLTLQC